MNRLSFKIALENRLRDVYEEDKKEALEYYNELFDDMGLSDNDEIPEEYQNIEKIIKDIKKDARINRVIEQSKNDNNLLRNILIIIGAIFASIFVSPFAIGMLGLVLGLFFGFIGLFIGLIGGTIGIIFGIVNYSISYNTFPLGMFGLLLILIGLTILSFIFVKFIIIKIKNFVVNKLNERKSRKENKYEK
ncbi:HAAS domain-containing protein [Miniphocaeibacter massiliensis]|uniref:HAAS domain-containing protein n=1 Tax=Miniphocaeibacter massiliensis TaxID=2041841 RepID=UPI000C1C488A|nr:DUF1700 domain-containing protein [Miniphocaeibacter massiliensis]